ncbi:ABC transporter ATP-binding protein [Paenibacillus hemerocallicola]|uniref:ABC transporter ATP-binding protein n=1 Tax=Paenibacillus hemerocallicola TaxID=1172614 RepID=A0A5C4T062_9BACL|nr:ABC transporter ATP-binding protein [Paenibacillus hemerocallicola]TNJ62363.1 ABC transporter ATP-binding protein [Paenibacillus hemerocallicola]
MLKMPGVGSRYGTMPLLRLKRSGGGPPKKGKVEWSDRIGTLRKIGAYLGVHRKLLALVVFMVLLSSAAGLLGPYLLGVAVDTYLVRRAGGNLLVLLAGLAGVYAVQTGATLLQHYWMIGVAQRTVARMREDLFAHLHAVPIPFYGKKQHGELMSRLTNDIDNVSQTLSSSFIQVFSGVVTFAGMLGFMLVLSPLLTVISLTVIPVMYAGMKWITARTGKLFREQQRHMGELGGFIEETISGQLIVKSFSRERERIAAFGERNGRLRAASYWAQTYSGFVSKLVIMLDNMSFAVIAAAGSLLAIQGIVTVGVIVTFAEYARQFSRPLNQLATQINTMLSAIAGAERAFEILSETKESDGDSADELAAVKGEIEFSHVSFAYGDKGDTLTDLTFRIKPGQTVALVGPTGAGKSTVVQLLTRFYEPNGGHIRIDGRDIRTIRRQSLRRHMGFVLQDTVLFDATVRDNIRYGRLEATDGEVERAAELANAHSFIAKLPEGYDTFIREGGSGISQGQKQLLAIARAVLADPSILILDEATSSIDTVTEIKIQQALSRLMKNRTSVVVAHRLSTIRQADLIVVLERGKIAEQGSHESLMERQGVYWELHRSKDG